MEELTLTSLLAVGLEEHLRDIQEISERATKEWNLEKALEKMFSEWRSLPFELKQFKFGGTLSFYSASGFLWTCTS